MTTQNDPLSLNRPELLAPAGDFAALQAAIRSGADAVYLGASAFSARRQAANFAGSQLTDAIDLAHRHGLRVCLALNTLIHDSELDEALALAGSAAAAGVDAIILQDTGLAVLLHEWLPDLPLHASTQMTITDAAGLHMAARLGFSRVILARELTLDEITALTQTARELGLETEVFIHGALCMSLSGQCLLSRLNGGRSGNRGDCAQPCRLPWTLLSRSDQDPAQAQDPVRIPAPDQKNELEQQPFPWLSPCDQSLLDGLETLAASGVAALKIEGRMRQPAYVGQVVSVYRQALDRIGKGQTREDTERAEAKRRLLIAFNRGGRFSSRPLSGQMGRDFLAGPYSGSHGLFIGIVVRSNARAGLLSIRSAADPSQAIEPSRGDILSVRDPGADKETASAPIGIIETQPSGWTVRGFHPDVLGKIRSGQSVYLMSSRRARQAAEQVSPSATHVRLSLAVSSAGVALAGRILNGPAAGLQASVHAAAETISPLKAERVHSQLSRTGGTPFRVGPVDHLADLPLSIRSLNHLRSRLLEQLGDQICSSLRRSLPPLPINDCRTAGEKPAVEAGGNAPRQHHLPGRICAFFYQLPQDPAQLPCGADRYLLPILSLTEATAEHWTAAIRREEPEAQILAWLPASRYGRLSRLLPPLLSGLTGWGFDGICATQAGSDLRHLLPETAVLDACTGLWTLDCGANVFNRCSLDSWLQAGAMAICPSVELDDAALLDLIRSRTDPGEEKESPSGEIKSAPKGRQPAFDLPVIEIPAYGHLRAMSNAFCPVGCNEPGCHRCHRPGLSSFHPDPGRTYILQDRKGYAFPLLTHPRVCQVELLQHEPLLDLEKPARLQTRVGTAAHIQARLFFLEESQSQRRRLVRQCRQTWPEG